MAEQKKLINGYQYSRISHFCQHMKIIHGNDFLNATLRHHPMIKIALTDYEREHILDLEREIKDSTS